MSINKTFQNNAKSIIKTIKTVRGSAALFLLLSGVFVVSESARQFALDYMSNEFGIATICILSIFLVARFIDIGFKDLAGFAVLDVLTFRIWTGGWQRSIFSLVVITLVYFMASTTLKLSDLSKELAVDKVVHKIEVEDVETVKSRIEKSNSDELKIINNLIDDFKEQKKIAQEEAKTFHHKALQSKGQEMYRLYNRPDDVWAGEQLAPSIKQAKIDSAKHIEKWDAHIEAQLAILNTTMATNAKAEQVAIASNETKINEADADYKNRRSTLNLTGSSLIKLALILMLACYIMEGLYLVTFEKEKMDAAYEFIKYDPIMSNFMGFFNWIFSFIPSPKFEASPTGSFEEKFKKFNDSSSSYSSGQPKPKPKPKKKPKQSLIPDSTQEGHTAHSTQEGHSTQHTAHSTQDAGSQGYVRTENFEIELPCALSEWDTKNMIHKKWFLNFCRKFRNWRTTAITSNTQETRINNAFKVKKGIEVLNQIGYRVKFGSTTREENVTIEDKNQVGLTIDPFYEPSLRVA